MLQFTVVVLRLEVSSACTVLMPVAVFDGHGLGVRLPDVSTFGTTLVVEVVAVDARAAARAAWVEIGGDYGAEYWGVGSG